jgi:hypothetical protein
MASKKLYDLAVKTGEYKDSTGAPKGRWQNIGAVMQSDDGSKFIMMAKWFNPAGVPDLSGKGATSESILVSLFPPKDRENGAAQPQRAPAPAAASTGGPAEMDDDIPF